MSEDKTQNSAIEPKNDEILDEAVEAVAEAEAKEVESIGSMSSDNDEPADRRPRGNTGLVELPESVRIKLEKQKEARLKKAKKRKSKKKQLDRKVTTGRAYIKSSYNNTIITLTDPNGNVLSWASAGIAGFKGPKKATPYAAQVITRIAVERAREMYKLEEVSVFVRGVGTGREAAVRALNANGLHITVLKDITPIPHNGCRAKKPRRV